MKTLTSYHLLPSHLRGIHACLVSIFVCLLLGMHCQKTTSSLDIDGLELLEVAQSDDLWTGIALSEKGRIFINYPRWSPGIPFSVGEITGTGEAKPYPDKAWNSWSQDTSPQNHFVCVQSVYVDSEDFLWILDPGYSIDQGMVVLGGPKLVKVDLSANRMIQTVSFDPAIAPENSYLNDVRVDPLHGYAYITDSGLGALIVVNLRTGQSRRVLDRHPSVKAEDTVLSIEGQPWLQPDGSRPQIHSDGIAITRDGKYVYYQALTGRSLYRIDTEWLRTSSISDSVLAEKVEYVGKFGASDGITSGPGGCIYLTSLEFNAIRRITPEGKLEMVFQDSRLKWPDSIVISDKGEIYVTISQIHVPPDQAEPYRIYKIWKRGAEKGSPP
jgi:sugar lactone lactonase YvrE